MHKLRKLLIFSTEPPKLGLATDARLHFSPLKKTQHQCTRQNLECQCCSLKILLLIFEKIRSERLTLNLYTEPRRVGQPSRIPPCMIGCATRRVDGSIKSYSVISNYFSRSAGLVGVLVGGWITTHNQKLERQQRQIREQLSDFYSILIGMKSAIRAKEIRFLVRFSREMEEPKEGFQVKLISLYRDMLAYVTTHMWFAEPSTAAHYDTLVQCVEDWSAEVGSINRIDMMLQFGPLEKNEHKLRPFFKDIDSQFERLRKELKK
jgi:hypothetical protein